MGAGVSGLTTDNRDGLVDGFVGFAIEGVFPALFGAFGGALLEAFTQALRVGGC